MGGCSIVVLGGGQVVHDRIPGGGFSWQDLLPQASNVRMMERAVHEWLGLAWLVICA